MESIVRENKIHFYEYMEVEILDNYIRSGIEYALNSFLSSHPTLIPLRYYSPDLAVLLKLIQDSYFLLTKQALYAENFYGLQRQRATTKVSALVSVCVWVVVPHLLRKLEELFLQWREEAEGGRGWRRRLLVRVFPLLYAAASIVQMVLKFRYLIFPDSRFYNLQYYVTRTATQYRDSQPDSKYPILELLKTPGLFLLLISHKIAAFFFAATRPAQTQARHPHIDSPIQQKRGKECGICGRSPRNKAVLKTSGYIFCYSCITECVWESGKCPMTGIKSGNESIQVLYD